VRCDGNVEDVTLASLDGDLDANREGEVEGGASRVAGDMAPERASLAASPSELLLLALRMLAAALRRKERTEFSFGEDSFLIGSRDV
jgi:hypothetical protein